ncbi:MAG TPA: molybdate ABC transporter substrate-binding protein [Pseudomonadales bacterium]|nr:molybdate ABC transporter substrate-binding protein [Pseudomonadales bacterium]
MRACTTLAVLLALLLSAPLGRADVTLFAAASLTDVGAALVDAWSRQPDGGPVTTAFAASSTLARQIDAGAPADLFISADARWMRWLEARGAIVETTGEVRIGNGLVIIAPADETRIADAFDAALLAAQLPPGERIAVGDPDHVPAGRYARAALEQLGLWSALAPRLARADNVRAALALVARGEAPLGIVYATDAAISERVRVVARLPAASHPEITYPLGIVPARARPEVNAFADFLRSRQAAPIWSRYGFEVRAQDD